MKIEQLEKATQILEEIKILKGFRNAFNDNSEPDIISEKYRAYISPEYILPRESKLMLDNYPDLKDFIDAYFLDKIEKLEKQLEEL